MASRPVITLAVLQEAIQAAEPDVVLESFEMAAGSGRGDNYTAMLYRVALRGRRAGSAGQEGEWRGSLICKVLPTSARRRDAYKSEALFRNEVAFYTRALPAMRRFEARRGSGSASSGSCTAAAPRCFLARDNLVVLEDLRTRGFTMVDRHQGLGEKQLRAVLSRVARFHGLSLAMKALEPEEFEREVVGTIRETQFLASNEGWYGGYYRTINTHVLNMVHDGLPEGEERARCLAAASAFLLDEGPDAEAENASFFKRMVALVKPVEPLAVLCHGDCWTNNFMFRYGDDGHIEEVMLVDYQMSRYASPCLDLMLQLYSCTERPVREARMEALLRHYHATLLDTMHRLGCTEPDFAQPAVLWDLLTSEMRRLGRFGLGQAVDYVSCLCCDSEEAPNVYDGQGDDGDDGDDGGGADGEADDGAVQGPAPLIIDNERCVRMMADLVQELVAKGDL